MAVSLLDRWNLYSNEDFRHRVRVAVIITGQRLMDEARGINEKYIESSVGDQMTRASDTELDRIIMRCCGNDTIAGSHGGTDDDLLWVVGNIAADAIAVAQGAGVPVGLSV